MRMLDDAKREQMLQEATRTVIDDVGIIPIHLQKNVWAMRQGLLHHARVDELTRAQDVAPRTRPFPAINPERASQSPASGS